MGVRARERILVRTNIGASKYRFSESLNNCPSLRPISFPPPHFPFLPTPISQVLKLKKNTFHPNPFFLFLFFFFIFIFRFFFFFFTLFLFFIAFSFCISHFFFSLLFLF